MRRTARLNMIRAACMVAVTGALLAGPFTAGPATGQAAPSSGALQTSADVEVQIKVTGKAIFRDGAPPATPTGTFPLGIPESPSYQFFLGSIVEDGCSSRMSMSIAPELTPPDPVPPIWWVVTAQMVSKQLDGAIVDFKWQRRLNSPWVRGAAVIDRTRRLTLIEGRPHILDYVPIESDDTDCDAMLIQAEVQFVDPPSVADTDFEYDLWLVHSNSSGNEYAQRVVQTGEQAESLEYGFAETRFSADGNEDANGPITMNVSGTVKGRARTDGRIDLILHARQGFGTSGAGRTTGTGSKALIVSPGEVVEIPFPPASGSLGNFDLGKLFAGQRTALRITARTI